MYNWVREITATAGANTIEFDIVGPRASPQFLVSVTAIEITAAGKFPPDFVSAYIYEPNLGGVNLIHAYLKNSLAAWHGKIPVHEPLQIKFDFRLAAAGSRLIGVVGLCERGEF
jgi:hypothetical protein